MIPQLQVAMVQSDLVWHNPPANRSLLQKQLEELGGRCHLCVLPEMFSTGFTMHPGQIDAQEQAATVAWMREQAVSHNFALCGSLCVEEGGRYYNRLYFFWPDGREAHYNKRHLFRMAGEDAVYSPGTERVVVELHGWRINLQVCYDLRFPVWSRQQGAALYDLLLYVANWPQPREMAWRQLLPARAIENLCFVCGVNRVGTDGNGIAYSGYSMCIDFKGNKLAEIPDKEQTQVVTLPAKDLKHYREKFPAHLDADGFELKK